MDLITLADLPELAGAAKTPTAKIVIGRLDNNLRDPRYGAFKITQAQVDSWKKNLAGVMGGQVSIDFDHSSDRGSGTRAAAWIKSIGQDGKLITADVEFSKRGARAVRNGDYRYTSPTFVADYKDEHGETHGPALIGAALTNRPVLRKGMPTLSLSKDEFDGVELADSKQARRERRRARKMLAARDSRPRMDREELITALGLEADADTGAILAAVVTLAASPPSPSRTPGAEASSRPTKSGRTAGNPPKGKKSKKGKNLPPQTMSTMDDERFAQLLLDANAGASAATQLAEDRFTHAFTEALRDGRAAPSQEANLRELHQANPDLALKTLASFVKIVPTTPAGSGDGGPASGPAPNGMDTERFQLHTEARQLAEQKVKANPQLDPGEAYALAAIEIEERKFTLENGSF